MGNQVGPTGGGGPDPQTLPPKGSPSILAAIRTPGYARVLLLASAIGVPVSAFAYGFVVLYEHLQLWVFQSLPSAVGFDTAPTWWPFPWLLAAGIVVGLALRFLPGEGGHSPADGLSPAAPEASALPGILVASLATLGLGIVLGPEAPLIGVGGGLGLFAAQKVLRHSTPTTHAVVGAAGSLAALGTIFGSPLTAVFFLIEGIGLGGEMLTLVLLPALAAAGIGSLMYVGLGRWTGVGAMGLAIPNLPYFARPDLPELGWCVVIGAGAALLAWVVRWSALAIRRCTHRRLLWATPLAGLAVGAAAVVFGRATGRGSSAVLFSGQSYMGPLIQGAATWTVGALVLLLVCKSIAYLVSLSSFRGGPVFPALLLGSVIGVATSHLPGFGLVPGIAAGMGGMSAAMLRLPVASILLPVLLLSHDALAVTPLVIVAVVVAFLTVQYLPTPESVAGVEAHVPASPVPAEPLQPAL